MLKDLRRIAKHGVAIMHPTVAKDGYRGIWLGFDDADVKWFLYEHRKIVGKRQLNTLRGEYEAFLRDRRFDLLYFWPFTKSQARALLREIGKMK